MSWPLTIEDRLILACARTEPDLPGIRDLGERDPDWTLLLRKVERSGLATVVYVNVKKVAELPNVVAERLRPLHHREAVYAVARRERLRTILVRLSEAGLPAVVPPATGDADLLVHDHDLDEVAALVQSIADPKRWSGRLAICSRVTVLTAAGIPIEHGWERARPTRIESVATLVPSPEDVVLQLALEVAARLEEPDGSGHGVRTLCEIGWACGSDGSAIDWRGVVTRARDYDVAAPLARALRLARDLVAARVPPDALEELSAGLPLAERSVAAVACEAMFSEGFDRSEGAPAAFEVPRAAVSGPASSEEAAGTLAVTYDPTTTDGVGSQLLRIYGLYALSRALDVKYVHTPIGLVGYQGFLPLLTGRTDSDFTARFNAFFSFLSVVFVLASCERVWC